MISLKKTIGLVSYFLVAMLLAYLVVVNQGAGLKVGQTPPLAENISLLNGKITNFKKLNTNGLFITFWATWCAPCRKELPIINELKNRCGNKINFIGIAIDSDDDEVKNFIQNNKISIPIGRVRKKASELWQVFSLPTTYILNSKGKIIWAKSGYLPKDYLIKMADKIFCE